MISDRLEEKHWLNVSIRFATDVSLFLFAYLIALNIRFSFEWRDKLLDYWFSILVGSLFMACCIYIFGYYSRPFHKINPFRQAIVLMVLSAVTMVVIIGASYSILVPPMGRGAMSIGSVLSFFVICIHHLVLNHWKGRTRVRVAVIVGDEEDEKEAEILFEDCSDFLELVGVITYKQYSPRGDFPVLGSVMDMAEVTRKAKVERLLCTNQAMSASSLFQKFCQLRYMGIAVMPIIGIYEEFHQFCPTELVTPEWLLQASTAPQTLYIRKMKRGFDIVLSLLGLVCLGPVLLLAIVIQKLFSRGPVFYRQTRLGRFGREFNVIKLRTMVPNAEKKGEQWAQEDDPRVTPLGYFYRKYRIDEIPQLFNVLSGEMSFVGPRPERPQFTETLSEEIPFFLERLLIQPGITGWAQVCYPYGSTVEDSRRKLEYDLYYIKHMSVFYDLFILLDTVRIILLGGSRKPHKLRVGRSLEPRTEPVSLSDTKLEFKDDKKNA